MLLLKKKSKFYKNLHKTKFFTKNYSAPGLVDSRLFINFQFHITFGLWYKVVTRMKSLQIGSHTV